MESIFPDVLFLGPYFAPLMLRIAVFLAYANIAYSIYKNRDELGKASFPFVGAVGSSVMLIGAVISGIIALSFAFGIATQAFALLGFIGALKGLVLGKKYPLAFPGERITYALLALLCTALFITGAGAFAFDLPY